MISMIYMCTIYKRVKMCVNSVKVIIPIAKPTNLPGHNNPPNASTIYLVPSMYVYEIIAPNISASKIGFSANHFHLNCPFV